jgi:hypothetical protein
VGAAAPTPFTRWDPQQANVPYLGWRGEELRLVVCAPAITVTQTHYGRTVGKGMSTSWIVESWSGDSFTTPALESSTASFFLGTGEHRNEGCAGADFVSLNAGLAQVKLVVSDSYGNPKLKQQFLAGWLSLETPELREVSAATGPNDPPGGGGVLGDPSGDGTFFAGDVPGRVQVQVSGSLPLSSSFTAGLKDLNGAPYPASIRLPAQTDGSTYWDDLAHSLATTAAAAYGATPWLTWDIHDDRTRATGHIGTSVCGAPFTAVDAVDSCVGASVFGGDGSYSQAFGTLSAAPTIGPFDPLRPAETLLSDGKLDSGDVPMPAALVEIGIKKNTGGTDLGGAGALAVADPSQPAGAPALARWSGVLKCIAYTRDNRCTSAGGSHPTTAPNVAPAPFGPAASNHYAPFYRRWLPATYARVGSSVDDPSSLPFVAEASGNDGPLLGNNFPGYLGNGLYDYWRIAAILENGPGGSTSCLRRIDGNSSTPDYRQKPGGPQRVQVFSDEHGEAQVYFTPGSDFFFDNLGITTNRNGGCDLEGVDVVGRAEIQAIVRYPYQHTTDADKASAFITKTVRSRFHKDVHCVLKGETAPYNIAFICTAIGIDVDGSPLAGERVCFMTNGEGMRTYPYGTPGETEGLGRLCVWLNGDGKGAVEIFCKNQQGNVIADFAEEGLIRYEIFQCVQVTPTPTTTTTTTTTTPAPTTTTTITTTTTVPPTSTTGPPTSSTSLPTPPPPTTTTTTTPPTTTVPITTTPKPVLKDVCPNIPGNQAKVPPGKTKVHGKCIAKKKPVVKAKKKKKAKPKGCMINGRLVYPCVRGKG